MKIGEFDNLILSTYLNNDDNSEFKTYIDSINIEDSYIIFIEII